MPHQPRLGLGKLDKIKSFFIFLIIAIFIGNDFIFALPVPARAQDDETGEMSEEDQLAMEEITEEGYQLLTEEEQSWENLKEALLYDTSDIFETVSTINQRKIVLPPYDAYERSKDGLVWRAIKDDPEAMAYYKKYNQPPQRVLDELQIEPLVNYDIRVIKTLNYLVTPEDQGGAGHEFIRVKRIRSGYTTEKRQYSKETTQDESEEIISAHYLGQAVDISEIDYLKCTLLKRRRLLSTKRIRQSPKPIKVGWQSEQGLAASNSPFGENFNQLAVNQTLGELDQYFAPDGTVRTNDIKDLIYQIGRRRIEEELDLEEGALDNATPETLYQAIGLAVLAQTFDLDMQRSSACGPTTESSWDQGGLTQLYINVALNKIEDEIKLPRGSIEGNDLAGVLSNIGKRKVEKDLELPSCYFSGQSVDWNKVIASINQHYGVYQDADDAFGLPGLEQGAAGSSVARLKNKDTKVFYVIGAAYLADLLNYSWANKRYLVGQVEKNNFTFRIDLYNTSLSITDEDLKAILQGNSQEKKTVLNRIGNNLYQQKVNSAVNNLPEEVKYAFLEALGRSPASDQLTKEDINQVINNPQLLVPAVLMSGVRSAENALQLTPNGLYYTFVRDKKQSKFVENLGEAYLEELFNLEKNSLKNNLAPFRQKIAGRLPSSIDLQLTIASGTTQRWQAGEISDSDYRIEVGNGYAGGRLIRELGLVFEFPRIGEYQLTGEDAANLLTGNWQDVLKKIGARYMEAELELPEGFVYNLISTENPTEALWEAGAKQIGQAIGLTRLDIRGINSLSDFIARVGRAKTEQTLALAPDSFQNDISYVREKNPNRFQAAFQEPSKVDHSLALDPNTTQKLLDGSVTVDQYVSFVGKKTLTKEFLDSLDIDQILGLDEKYEIKGSDLYSALFPPFSSGSLNDLKNILINAASYSVDDFLHVEKNTTQKLLQATSPKERWQIIVDQGIKKIAQQLGIHESYLRIILIDGKGSDYNCPYVGCVTYRQKATEAIMSTTKIPDASDASAFLDGRVGQALTFWGIAYFAEQNKGAWGDDATVAYNEMRMAFMGDELGYPNNPNSPERVFVNQQLNGITDSSTRQQAEEAARKEFRKRQLRRVSYHLITHQLQEIDPSIPDGFAETIFEGSAEDRAEALINYIGNRLGQMATEQLINIFSNWGLNPQESSELANQVVNAAKDGRIDATEAATLKNSFTQVAYGWLDGQLKEWLGIDLPSGTAQAIIQFASSGFSINGVDKELRQNIENWTTDLAFGWMDKKWFGGQLGTAKKIYEAYKTYNEAYNAYQAAKAAGDAAQTAQAAGQLRAVEANAIALVITLVFQKQLAQLDQQWGLVPGTMSLVVSFILVPSPITLAIIIIMNLFGVYKVEMYCSVAGYPRHGGEYFADQGEEALKLEAEGAPGIFNALDSNQYKEGLIKAAQFRVRNLLKDLLEMPEKMVRSGEARSKKEIKPQQIITLRHEDVDALKDYLKRLYGSVSDQGEGVWTQGRQGMWATSRGDISESTLPQMWESIHVGY